MNGSDSGKKTKINLKKLWIWFRKNEGIKPNFGSDSVNPFSWHQFFLLLSGVLAKGKGLNITKYSLAPRGGFDLIYPYNINNENNEKNLMRTENLGLVKNRR